MQREVLRPSSSCRRNVGRRLCLIVVLGAASISAATIFASQPDAASFEREVRVHLADRPRIELGVPLAGDAMSDYRAHVVPRIDHQLLERLSSVPFDAFDVELDELLEDPLVERIVTRFGWAQRRENVGTPHRDLMIDLHRRSELVLAAAQQSAARGEDSQAWMLGVALRRAADDMLGRETIVVANTSASLAIGAEALLERVVSHATRDDALRWLEQVELLKLDRLSAQQTAIALVLGERAALARMPPSLLGSDRTAVARQISRLSKLAHAIDTSEADESHRLCLKHQRAATVCEMLTEAQARFQKLGRTLDVLEASLKARLMHLESKEPASL